MPPLTKTAVVKLAAAPNQEYSYLWCSEVPGFGVRVRKSGSKSYVLQYRNKRGQGRRIKIGDVASVGLDDARRQAREYLSQISTGQDPAQERAAAKVFMTVAELAERYMADSAKGLVLYKGRPLQPATVQRDVGRLRRHIIPLIGRMAIEDVHLKHVSKMHDDVVDGKTAVEVISVRHRTKVTGGSGTARKCVFLLSSIYRYAIKRGFHPGPNPCHGIETSSDDVRDRSLTAAEYRALGNALKQHASNGGSPMVVGMIWALALTGFRKGEMVKLERDEVSLIENGIWLKKSKVGPGQRPVGATALAFIRNLDPGAGQWMFPSPLLPGDHIADIDKTVGKVTELAGLTGVTAHILRHSYATLAGNELGYSELIIGGILGHSRKTVTSKYVKKVQAVLADAATDISNRVAELMGFDLAPIITSASG